MATIEEYIDQLKSDREDLVDNLETMGIQDLEGTETFTELVPQVLNIPVSGGQVIQYEQVPTASSEYEGKIIQFIGTTDSNYTNGYFYKCIDNGGTYEWVNVNVQTDVVGQIIQYATMPTANADNLGKIVQFVGTSTNDYTNGYFYKCVSDGQVFPTYSWANIYIQPDIPFAEYNDANATIIINSLKAHTVYKFNTPTSITINQTIVSNFESIIYFRSGSTPTAITLPASITHIGDAPTFTPTSSINNGTCDSSTNYIVSILNNIAIWKAY